ncbi:holo-ACP synthase [Acinetobacter johnsonii]|uniref:holo-ACP synthase n=1 Tax=Acinetobacter johnsonii TaxID=40214 RepID=UPI0024486B37|nr:holo-ACP synthase [Acinetobacter johnsonii]MDH1699783.1 holo-ACP synthase [Acinetobacter johnsonii]
MMSQYIICHGVDLLDLEDFSKIFNHFPKQFKNVYFTKTEQLSVKENINAVEKFSSRFAIKEAVMKALRVGWGNGVAFTDIEVITETSGSLSIKLYRKLEEIQIEKGIKYWSVSTSHSRTSVIASVIGTSL